MDRSDTEIGLSYVVVARQLRAAAAAFHLAVLQHVASGRNPERGHEPVSQFSTLSSGISLKSALLLVTSTDALAIA